MRATVFAAGLLVLGAAAVFAQAGSKAATEKALIANENKINDAVAKHDVKTFTDLVAADAMSADGGGFMKVSELRQDAGSDEDRVVAHHGCEGDVGGR